MTIVSITQGCPFVEGTRSSKSQIRLKGTVMGSIGTPARVDEFDRVTAVSRVDLVAERSHEKRTK
jgi:hypothetical protein